MLKLLKNSLPENVRGDGKKGSTMEKVQIMDDEVLTIQQMAQISGLSAHTLRYYERAGLMPQHVGRNEANGYRYYTRQDASWIEFIKCLRATGMPIRDVQRYTELIGRGEDTSAERMQLLKEHRSRVEEHLSEVEQHLSAINYKISYYEQMHMKNNQCDVTREGVERFSHTK
jgi:DNA-binding transcriptional MerR regulator